MVDPHAAVTHGQLQLRARVLVRVGVRLHLAVADRQNGVSATAPAVSVTALPTSSMRATRGRWATLCCKEPCGTAHLAFAGRDGVRTVATAHWASSALPAVLSRTNSSSSTQ